MQRRRWDTGSPSTGLMGITVPRPPVSWVYRFPVHRSHGYTGSPSTCSSAHRHRCIPRCEASITKFWPISACLKHRSDQVCWEPKRDLVPFLGFHDILEFLEFLDILEFLEFLEFVRFIIYCSFIPSIRFNLFFSSEFLKSSEFTNFGYITYDD
jgi:hypothetical protein